MDEEIRAAVDDWERTPAQRGFRGLHALADEGFTGAVTAGGACGFMVNGNLVGVFDGDVSAFDGAELTARTAPDPSVPLLYAMWERDAESESRARYYTNDTPLSEVVDTLSEGGFTGYVELSENVLSGDYYAVFSGGRAMWVAFVGNSRRLLTGEEARERAVDEVGIYEVTSVDVDVVALPDPESEPGPRGDAADGEDDAGDVAAAQTAVTFDDETAADEDDRDDAPSDRRDAPTTEGDDAAERAGRDADDVEATAEADEDKPEWMTSSLLGTDDEDDADTKVDSDPAAGPVTLDDEGSDDDIADDEDDDIADDEDDDAAHAADSEVAVETDEPDASHRDADAPPADEPPLDDGETAADDTASGDGETAADEPVEFDAASEEPESEGSDTGGAGTADAPSHDSETGSDEGGTDATASERTPVERGSDERADAAETGESLRAELQSVEAERDRLRAELRDAREERNALRERVDDLEAERQSLRDRLDRQADAEADAAPTRSMSAEDALAATNLFVRYRNQSDATLEDAHDGRANREAVVENLRIEHHTNFDESAVGVDGVPFESFLSETVEYGLVEWLVRDLLYDIAATGNEEALDGLYDAIPRIDRVQLRGSVSLPADSPGGEATDRSFDLVCWDARGDPLLVADVNDTRDPTTSGDVSALVDGAEAVADAHDIGAAVAVTASFFESDALEAASEATSGGLFSRSSRKSYVKLSRKRGFHLCLAEARKGEYHLSVPEL